MRSAASSATISASELLWLTAVCFLHNQLMGQKVRGPTRHSIEPDVDLLSLRSPAKDASTNNINLQSDALSPQNAVSTWSCVKCV